MVGIEAKAATYARNVYNGVPGYTLEKAKKFFASDYRVFEWWYNYYAAQKASLLALSRYGYVGVLNFKNKKDVGRIIANFRNNQLEGFSRMTRDLYGIELKFETVKGGRTNFTLGLNFKSKVWKIRKEVIKTAINLVEETNAYIESMNKNTFWNSKMVKQFENKLTNYLETSINVLEEVTGVLNNE